MSTNTTAAEAPAAPIVEPVAAPAVVAATQAATVVAEPTPTIDDVRSLSAAEQDALLFGGPMPEPAKPAAPVVPAGEVPKPAEPEPAAVAEVPPVVEPEKILPNRIATKQFNDREQEAIKLKHDLEESGEQISLREACERVDLKYGVIKPQQAAAAPEVTPAPAAPVEPPHITAAKAELADLAQKIKDAARDNLGSDEVEDMRLAYTDKLTDLKTEIRTEALRSELQQQRTAESERNTRLTAREATKAATLNDFPTANDGNSALGKEITLLFNQIQADPNHPDRARLAQDDGPRWLTERAFASKVQEAMKDFGLTEAQAQQAVRGKPTAEAKSPVAPATPQTPQVTPVPRTILVTAPGGAQAPEPVALTDDMVLEAARRDPKVMDAALFGAGDWIVS